MAFVVGELSLMANTGAGTGNGFYFYANTAGDTVTASGFFDAAADMLRQGDLIYDVDGQAFVAVTSESGATPVTTGAVGGGGGGGG